MNNPCTAAGDDCVSIGSGCYDVDIRNITCGPSHGIRYMHIHIWFIYRSNMLFPNDLVGRVDIRNPNLNIYSIGSLGNHNSRACASNISVRDSVIKNSDNGVRIKTWQGGWGAVSGVSFQNIRMENVRNPIIIDQFYCLSKECSNHSSAVYVSDIEYSDIKGTYDVRSPPMHLACSDSIPCTNITISDVELLPAVGDLVLDPFCWNAYGELNTLTIPPMSCLMEGIPPSMLQNDVAFC